jgi:hypothetical protein
MWSVLPYNIGHPAWVPYVVKLVPALTSSALVEDQARWCFMMTEPSIVLKGHGPESSRLMTGLERM